MPARRAVMLALFFASVVSCRASQQPSAAKHEQPLIAADAGEPRADCHACHARDYASAPRHEGVKPTRCAVCHVETGWHPIQRNHPWPLTGAHEQADCFACHSGKPPVFEELPSACVDCHRDDYDRSDYPGHDRFPLTCADCHSTSAWKPAKKPLLAGAKSATGAREETHPPRERAAKPARNEHPAAPRAQPTRSAPETEPTPEAPPPQTAEPHTPPPTAANQRQHPESAFPIRTGNHADIECATCHDGPGRNGKDNTDCVQCHKRSRFDGRHTQVPDYPSGAAPANFCVDCHTRGTRATRDGRSSGR